MADPLLPEDPVRVGEYRLVGRLGDGGQGSVYLGEDAAGRRVAVKLLHARLSRDAAARTRFVRELEVAERVAGFCTAKVLDADIQGDRPYIVGEFVDGPALGDLVRDGGPLDTAGLLRLAIGTATALTAIHRAGIVHRDFKPPNVLIGPGGPRVIDFGIARALDSAAITVTSQVVGTPAYMAPEQVAGAEVGPPADVFAWGGTMLFAATGRLPFPGDSIPAVLHRVLNDDPDLRALPASLAGIVGECMAKDPGRRPTAAGLLHRLVRMIGAEEPAGADRSADPSGDLLERGATLVATGLTDVVLRPAPPVARRRRPLVMAAVPVSLVVVALLVLLVPQAISRMRDHGGASGPASGGKAVELAFIGSADGLGAPMLAGAKIAVNEHNAANPRIPARLVELDTGSGTGTARRAAEEAVRRGVGAVVGPSLSTETRDAAPILEKAAIPSVSPGAAEGNLSERGWKYWHTTVPDSEASIRALADLAARRSPGEALVLEDGTALARDTANFLEARLETKGLTVRRAKVDGRAEEHAEAVAAMRGRRTGAVFFGGAVATSAALIEQARAAGVGARFYLTDMSMTGSLVEEAGAAAEGTVLTCSCLFPEPAAPGALTPGLKDFATRFAKANGGRRPPAYAAEGHDAASAILRALRGGKRTGRDINAYLGGMDFTGGLTQRIRFTGKGELTDARSYAYQVQNKTITLLGDSAAVPAG